MAFSVVLSYSLIDWKMAFNWTYFLIAVTLGISLFSNESLWITTVEVQRPDANVALNTISFGHLGATGTILSLYCFGKMKLGVLNKIVVIVVMALSIYCMLRAASRGPVIAFAIVSLFWMICRFRRLSLGLTIITCTMALIIVFLDPIISVLGEISPILEMRLRDNNDSTTRFPIYSAAINAFLDNPITGKQFVVFFGGTTYAYPHNIVLEAFMALGLLGGVILVYILVSAFKVCYLTVHSSREDYWISLILIQQTAALFFSGTFYEDQVLSALLAYVFMAHYRPITRKTILNAI
jgi:O-antigen ligase